MQDPSPENIQGRKVHEFSHQIRWDFLLLGFLGLYLALKLFGDWPLDHEEEEADEGATVEIEDTAGASRPTL